MKHKKIIIISRVTDKLFNLIYEDFRKRDKRNKIIIKSSNLRKKSKLRNLFEKDKKVICTPVYEDDNSTLIKLLKFF